MPSPDQFANYALTTLAGGAGGNGTNLNPTDLSLVLASGTGAIMPSVYPFMLQIGTPQGLHELVQVTARSTDTCTIVRGLEGTSAQTWTPGVAVEQVVTAGSMNDLWVASTQVYNVRAAPFNAKGDGATDDTSAIAAAITAAANAGGGIVYLPPPSVSYRTSAPLTLATAGVRLQGAGKDTTILSPLAGFSGAQLILCSADFTGVADLTLAGAITTYSSNPAANGIQVTGARSVRIANVDANYLNGWVIQSSATAGVANYWARLENVHSFQCAQGAHVLGVTGSSFNMGHSIHNCNFDQCQNGDGLLLEDAHDIEIIGLYGTVTAGSGNSLHVKGACAAVYVSALDLGPAPGPSTGAVVLIESGSNGSPKQIDLTGGIVEGGTSGVQVTAGTLIGLRGLDIFNNGTYGVNLSGACDGVTVQGNRFSGNGSAGSSGRYDFQSSTSGHVDVCNNQFATAQGATTGLTNNVINVTAGTVVVHDNDFIGAGYNNSNIVNSYPYILRNNLGYNPLGQQTAPTITASPCTPSTKSSDFTVFIAGGTVTSVKIGGVVTGLTSGSFRVPAQQSITLTYTVLPSWTWFGD